MSSGAPPSVATLRVLLISDLDGGLFILDAQGPVVQPVPALGTAGWLLLLGMLGAAAGHAQRFARGISKLRVVRPPFTP